MPATTTFNPTQIYLLRLFQFHKTEESLQEMKEVLSSYYSKKVDQRMNELWDNGTLNQEKLDQLRHMHIRDILKQ